MTTRLLRALLWQVEAIKQLIGEAENAQVVGFNVTYGGFGYSKETPPKVRACCWNQAHRHQ